MSTIETLTTEVARLAAENDNLKRTRARVIAEVMEYEGCREGKLEFLEQCGITFPSHTVKMTVVMNVVAGTDFTDLVEHVQSALDSECESNAGASAYVVGAEIVADMRANEVAAASRGAREPEGWVSV